MSSATPESMSREAPSKPGRKPIKTEPTNKRTAQNRAAQRAFRERKERKMQELEMKVKLLENEKLQITNETELLRVQVDALMKELMKARGGEPVNIPLLNRDSLLMLGVGLSSTGDSESLSSSNASTSASEGSHATSTDSERSTSNLSTPGGSSQTPVSSCSSTSAEKSQSQDSTEFQFPWPSNKEKGQQRADPVVKLEPQNIDLNQENYKGEFNEEVSFCNSLGTVCGTKDCPVPSAQRRPSTTTGGTSASASSAAAASTAGVGSLVFTGSEASRDSPFHMLADYNNGRQGSVSELPFLFDTPTYDAGLVFDNNSAAAFSPADFVIPEHENLAESSNLESLVTEESRYDPLGEFFANSQQLTTDNLNLLNDHSTTEQAIAILQEGSTAAASAKEVNEDEKVPDTSSNMLKCSQIWERMTTHPRFSELDIDGLCSELKQKAKCSERGVVVDGSDVGALLNKAAERTLKTERDMNLFLQGLK